MSQTILFQRRAVAALVAVALLSLGLAAVLALDGPRPPSEAPVPSTASRAATGHRAFLVFARALGYTVRTTSAFSGDGALVVMEPELLQERPETGQALGRLILNADTVLVVLPKWTGEGDPGHPGWLAQVRPLPAADVAVGLSALGIAGTVERHDGTLRLHSAMGGGDAEIDHAQLLSTSELEPLVSGPEGMLVGERQQEDEVLVVVADPDLLSNAGLHRGDNAGVVAALLERLTGGQKTPVVIDESLLPHARRNLLAGLLGFPTVLAVLQLLLCLGLAVWAGLVRFGAPLEEPEAGPRGAAALVEGAVALQLRVGSPSVALGSLLLGAIRDVSDKRHAPAGLTDAALDRWFESRSAAAGDTEGLGALRHQVLGASDTRRVVAAAQAVQRWRRRMVHGTQ